MKASSLQIRHLQYNNKVSPSSSCLMFSADKSRQCPRCRSALAKTHSEKMICRRCGYTSNRLQVVREEENFGSSLKFAKKVHLKKDKQTDQKSEDCFLSYIECFQDLLAALSRQMFSTFVHDLNLRKACITTCRNLWFAYLTVMSKQRIRITGKMGRLILKSQKLRRNSQSKLQKPSLEEDDSHSQSNSESECSQDDQEDSQERVKLKIKQPKERSKGSLNLQEKEAGFQSRKKRGRSSASKTAQQQKDPHFARFKKFFLKVWKDLTKSLKGNANRQAVPLFSKKMLFELINFDLESGPSSLNESASLTSKAAFFSTLMYTSQKYVLLLCFELKQRSIEAQKLQKKSFERQERNRAPSQNPYLHSKYSRVQDIKKICSTREIRFERRRVHTELKILLCDLLKTWHEIEHQGVQSAVFSGSLGSTPFLLPHYSFQQLGELEEPVPYEYFRRLYRSSYKKVTLIDQLMSYVDVMTQEEVFKHEQAQKQFPQPSMKLICSFLNLTLINHGVCLRLLEIVNFCHLTAQRLCDQRYESYGNESKEVLMLLLGENVRVRKTVKVCNMLLKVVEPSQVVKENFCLQKWCRKYAQLLEMPRRQTIEWVNLARVLFEGHLDNRPGDQSCLSPLAFRTTPANSSRFLVLEQEYIILGAMVIYCKLKFAMENEQYPYLKNVLRVMTHLEGKQNLDREDPTHQAITNLTQFYHSHKPQSKFMLEEQFSLLGVLVSIQKATVELKSGNELKDIGHLSAKEMSDKTRLFGNSTGDKNIVLMHYPRSKAFGSEETNVQVARNQSEVDRKQHSTHVLKFEFSAQAKLQCVHLQRTVQRLAQLRSQALDTGDPATRAAETKALVGGIEQFVDRPEQNYELIYNPSLNALTQLQLNEQLLLLEKLGKLLFGEGTDCREVTEWKGHLESVLVMFEN